MQKKAERRRKRQEIRSAQHIAQQAREATPPDEDEEIPPGEPNSQYVSQQHQSKYGRHDPDTPPRPQQYQHQSSFTPGNSKFCIPCRFHNEGNNTNLYALMSESNTIVSAYTLYRHLQ